MPNYQADLNRAFHALADAGRRSMVERLCAGPASVKELAAPLDMSLPAVMQHLSVLEEAGLVRSDKIGRTRICRIEPQAISLAETWLNERRATWSSRFDALGAFLDAEDEPSPGEQQ